MPPPSNAPRPGRILGVLVLLVIVLYGVMFLKGSTSPKLGLDLSSGTTVTLSPVTLSGKQAPSSSINEAIKIIRQRVNAFGVSEAQVTKEGNNIVVAIPGAGQKQVVQQVGQTAQLRFRQALLYQPTGAPTTPQQPQKSGAGKNTGKGKSSAQATPGASSSPSASPSASPKSKGRALSSALEAEATPSPSASPSSASSGKASKTSSSKASPKATAQPPPLSQQQLYGNTSGIKKRVLADFKKVDCSHPNKTRETVRPPKKQVVACDKHGNGKYVLAPAKVLGTMLTGAQAGLPSNGQFGNWEVNLSLNGKGTSRFAAITKRVVSLPPPRNEVAIVLDGVVVSAPRITEAIPGGHARITGDFTQKQAQNLANVLRYGSLPLKFKKSQIQSVSPTLGADQLRAGLIAGAIGLLLVVLYSILYYRGLALVSVLSLASAGVIVYAAVVLLGVAMDFRLSLAGIAGIIVAIGITADSFIVFFERLRDEVREGRTLRSAVERGWGRARRTIITADAVSFLAALVLWILAIGSVRGFAFTLGLTTLIDVVVVFIFTKPMVTLLARTKFYGRGHRLSGLDPKRLGARREALIVRSTRRRGTAKEA